MTIQLPSRLLTAASLHAGITFGGRGGFPQMTYSEKLRDPRWQRRRLEIFNRDDWTCRFCGATTATLHVHHYTYREGFEPWQHEDADLVTLCENCHTYIEDVVHRTAPANCFEIIKTGRFYYFINVFADDELRRDKQEVLMALIDILRSANREQLQVLAQALPPEIIPTFNT